MRSSAPTAEPLQERGRPSAADGSDRGRRRWRCARRWPRRRERSFCARCSRRRDDDGRDARQPLQEALPLRRTGAGPAACRSSSLRQRARRRAAHSARRCPARARRTSRARPGPRPDAAPRSAAGSLAAIPSCSRRAVVVAGRFVGRRFIARYLEALDAQLRMGAGEGGGSIRRLRVTGASDATRHPRRARPLSSSAPEIGRATRVRRERADVHHGQRRQASLPVVRSDIGARFSVLPRARSRPKPYRDDPGPSYQPQCDEKTSQGGTESRRRPVSQAVDLVDATSSAWCPGCAWWSMTSSLPLVVAIAYAQRVDLAHRHQAIADRHLEDAQRRRARGRPASPARRRS